MSNNEIETIRLLLKSYSVAQIAIVKNWNVKIISFYKYCFFRK